MRKMRGLVSALLLGVLLSFGAPTAAAAAPAVVSVVHGPLAEQANAPVGPVIDPADNERANAQKTKNKIVVGVIAAVLLGIVLWGRSIRRKKRKKSSDQAKGK
ncbi:hypothetical protein [Amycolatopsis alkalitolerans]|uniref:LPXTG cell wall anchor domain-containing protein n=1 Tax=Amycolatopsis alkalitolerans TaxID=2547244 RepID=A0A5C4LQF7_9PSEU|nr:hypothetical protein [Amycolatopsis alkalitolerans]TNC20693.1 hypothetical protein FG385_30515 [Amycolatopsis alkalitolerans]